MPSLFRFPFLTGGSRCYNAHRQTMTTTLDQSAPRRAFITGGAGFLGINLTRYLLDRGFAVTTYDLAPFDYPERDRITPVHGDIRDAGAVTAAMGGAHLVVHAAARSEEHTSELQSRQYLVCRLLLEKKKTSPLYR